MMNTDTLERLQTAPKVKSKPFVETAAFKQLKESMGKIVPPIVIMSILLLIWEILCSGEVPHKHARPYSNDSREDSA